MKPQHASARWTGPARLAAAAVTVLAVAACGGTASPAASPAEPLPQKPLPAPTKPVTVAAEPQRAVGTSGGRLTVRAGPAAGAEVLTELPATTPLGSSRVLLVQGVRGDWVEVALPVRPNGSTGWVRAADVHLEPVSARIEVDLAARSLTLVVDGRQVTRTTVAIGSPDDPTPTGSFFVTDRVRAANPRGTYGPFALGLSAHSESLSEFGGGDAQVGIHGTNDPGTLGKAVSHGCIRVRNDVAEMLEQVPLGTPVVIT